MQFIDEIIDEKMLLRLGLLWCVERDTDRCLLDYWRVQDDRVIDLGGIPLPRRLRREGAEGDAAMAAALQDAIGGVV